MGSSTGSSIQVPHTDPPGTGERQTLPGSAGGVVFKHETGAELQVPGSNGTFKIQSESEEQGIGRELSGRPGLGQGLPSGYFALVSVMA